MLDKWLQYATAMLLLIDLDSVSYYVHEYERLVSCIQTVGQAAMQLPCRLA